MSVIWTGRAVTPAHLNPAVWWRWIAQWKSRLILMNRGEKEHLESFILSVSFSLSLWFSCFSARSSSGTQNNSYFTHRQASKPSNTHTHTYSEMLPGTRVLGDIQTHDSRIYSPLCVCSVKLDGLEAFWLLFMSTNDNWLMWSNWTRTHTHT